MSLKAARTQCARGGRICFLQENEWICVCFLSWLVSEQLANSACAGISKHPEQPLWPRTSRAPSGTLAIQAGAGGAGASPGVRALQGLRCPMVRLGASVCSRSRWAPLRAHTHRPCRLPRSGRAHAGQSAELQPGQGLCSCWLVRHLLRDVPGGPVTSAFTAPRRGCASEELNWWWRRRLVERGYGVRKRKKLVLGLTMKHCRRKPPGVLCRLLSTERAAGIWGPHSVPTANQGCPERARGHTVAQLLEAGRLCGSRLCSCLFSALWFNIRFTKKTAEPSWTVLQCWRLAWRGLLLLWRLESLSGRP